MQVCIYSILIHKQLYQLLLRLFGICDQTLEIMPNNKQNNMQRKLFEEVFRPLIYSI